MLILRYKIVHNMNFNWCWIIHILSDASTFWHQYFVKFFFISIPDLKGSLTEISLKYKHFICPSAILGRRWGEGGKSLWTGTLFWTARPGVSKFWHTGQKLYVHFYWNTATSACLPVVCVCFAATLAELSSYGKDHRAHKTWNIFSLVQYRKSARLCCSSNVAFQDGIG